MIDVNELKETLCHAFCADVGIRSSGGLLNVSLPMTARDGDSFSVYLARSPAGWRISDAATTMMRLSYENDLNFLFSGQRGRLYETILAETGLKEDDGELFLDVPADQLIVGMFRVGQALSRIEDLALWTRSRVESTFYSDLKAAILSVVPKQEVTEAYVPAIPGGEDYLIDYRVEAQARPLYVFGVNGKDKARLTTITLLKLKAAGEKFDSMVVLNDIADLPRADESRLLEAANDVVPNITNIEAIREKIQHRRA